MASGGEQGRLPWGEEVAPSDHVAQLMSCDPGAWPVASDWCQTVSAFWASQAGSDLLRFLRGRLEAGAVVYPPEPFRALALTALDAVKVVIVGQDPYHGPGQAQGLAFSVAPGLKNPPSLRNIFKELKRDLGLPTPSNGSLVRWAAQGVLLINTSLTVEDGRPASHSGQGWEALTDQLIRRCNAHAKRKAFLLWGAHAQKKASMIDGCQHLVLAANHPSPLSASRGPVPFLGCGHFGAVNRWLEANGEAKIQW